MKSPIAPDALNYLCQMSVLPFLSNAPRISVSFPWPANWVLSKALLSPVLPPFLFLTEPRSLWPNQFISEGQMPENKGPQRTLTLTTPYQLKMRRTLPANVAVGCIGKQAQNKDTPFNLFVWGTSWGFHWHLTPRHKTHFSLKLQDFHFGQFQMV